MSEWMPIETAPLDGTVVDLLTRPDWAGTTYAESHFNFLGGLRAKVPGGTRPRGVRFVDAYYCSTHKCWRARKCLHYVHRPPHKVTHWMPIAEFPALSA